MTAADLLKTAAWLALAAKRDPATVGTLLGADWPTFATHDVEWIYEAPVSAKKSRKV